MVHRLTLMMGGRIAVESTLGQGSIFTLHIPTAATVSVLQAPLCLPQGATVAEVAEAVTVAQKSGETDQAGHTQRAEQTAMRAAR